MRLANFSECETDDAMLDPAADPATPKTRQAPGRNDSKCDFNRP